MLIFLIVVDYLSSGLQFKESCLHHKTHQARCKLSHLYTLSCLVECTCLFTQLIHCLM